MEMATERKGIDGSDIEEGAGCPWPRAPRVGNRTGLAWYLLQAKSGVETKLRDFLKQFGYEVYYPKTLVLRPVPKRELTPSQRGAGAMISRPQLMAIFPSYPFIRFDVRDERCHELFDFAGVYGMHCAAGQPVVADDAWINHLKSLEDDGVIPAATSLRQLFEIGENVLIKDGPFKCFNGIVEELPIKLQQQLDDGVLSELDESMCATIAINIFGRSTRSKLPLSSLEKFK
jgi:transcriptional antiterminator NusG